ncbi:flagellar biosynthetic protein FliR [Cohnella abietis]|uniref:Flagellar biosynthetic protein FliR n=2 Tax=Cohnella abietis TaxID=2507935 RepID=A0A3T1D8M4_9BACL|nr:flagellar biosynthetic protein FliR [Cohnella abietis]
MQVLPGFLLVFCRISSFFIVAPIFSSRTFPTFIKIGLAFFVSLIVFLTVGFDSKVLVDATYILAILREVFAGLLIGYTSYIFFTIVQTSGALMDMQMGLAMANIVNPVTGTSSPIMGNLKYMLLMLVFLSINGHHYLLAAIMDSYKWLPLDNQLFQIYYGGQITEFLARTFADTFLVALQIAAPIVVAMFLTDFGLALLARTAPQYNVFVIGIPIKILVGLSLMVLLLPGFSALFQIVFDNMFGALEKLFTLLKSSSRA